MIVEKKMLPVPVGWSPQVYPKQDIHNMKPYIYSPLPDIPRLNLPGSQNVVTQNDNNYLNSDAQNPYSSNQLASN